MNSGAVSDGENWRVFVLWGGALVSVLTMVLVLGVQWRLGTLPLWVQNAAVVGIGIGVIGVVLGNSTNPREVSRLHGEVERLRREVEDLRSQLGA